MEDTGFYVEFAVNDAERFRILQDIFDELKTGKDNDSFREDDFYLKFFDDKAKSYFGWYSDEENLEWSKKWFSTPYEQRWSDPSLERKWDFGSMIDSFKNGDYELLSCEMISEDKARIVFNPWGHPYGGTGCIRALIEALGFEVLEVRD